MIIKNMNKARATAQIVGSGHPSQYKLKFCSATAPCMFSVFKCFLLVAIVL